MAQQIGDPPAKVEPNASGFFVHTAVVSSKPFFKHPWQILRCNSYAGICNTSWIFFKMKSLAYFLTVCRTTASS